MQSFSCRKSRNDCSCHINIQHESIEECQSCWFALCLATRSPIGLQPFGVVFCTWQAQKAAHALHSMADHVHAGLLLAQYTMALHGTNMMHKVTTRSP